MSMRRLVAVAVVLAAAGPALADDPIRVKFSEYAKRAPELAGKTIKLVGAGELKLKPTTVYGCGFAKKAWFAFELTDGTDRMFVYCAKANSHCKVLDRGVRKEPEDGIFPPVLNVPAKAASCKKPMAELVWE